MRREGCLAARLFAACGVAWADAMGVSVCWSVGRAQWRGCRERLIGAGAGAANCAAVGSPHLRAVLAGARPRGADGS